MNQIFTKEELKVLRAIKEQRDWDPDMRAVIALVEGVVARYSEEVMNEKITGWLDELLRKRRVACIFFDLFGRGNVGVTKRSGIMGVGPDLWTALEHMTELDSRFKHSRRATAGLDVGEEEESDG